MTANAALRQETTMVPGVNVFCPFPSTPKFKRLKEELKRNIREKRVASVYYTHIRASYNGTSGGVKIRGEEREVLWKWKCLCCFITRAELSLPSQSSQQVQIVFFSVVGSVPGVVHTCMLSRRHPLAPSFFEHITYINFPFHHFFQHRHCCTRLS